jgi:hypothetical protein
MKFLLPQYPDDMKFAVDSDGKTLLHVAAVSARNESKVIKYLLSRFPAPMKYVRDKQGKTFLDYQYKKDRLQWLIEDEADYPVSEEDRTIFLAYSPQSAYPLQECIVEYAISLIEAEDYCKQFFQSKYMWPAASIVALIAGIVVYKSLCASIT